MTDYDLSRYDKVHLWIGTNTQPDSEYQTYFEIDYSTEGGLDDPDYRVCGFCKDVGIQWYDEDFIGIIPRRNEPVTIDEILEDAAVDKTEWPKVKAACAALGIVNANAVFWYSDGDLALSTPLKSHYNELRYVGLFEGD